MNFRFRQPSINQSSHSAPCVATFPLASAFYCMMPVSPYLEAERMQCWFIAVYTKISIVPTNHLFEPFPYFWNWLMHAFSQFDFDFLQLCSHSLTDRFADHHKHAVAVLLSHNVGEPKKIETLWPTQSSLQSTFNRIGTKFDQMCFLWMQRECKFLESRLKLALKTLRYAEVLESNNEIISPAHDNHIAETLALPPLMDPKVERIVKIDICQQGRDDPSLCEEKYYAK